MRYGRGAGALAALLIGGCVSAPLAAPQSVDPIELRDRSTVLTCVPRVGRVMSFSRPGEPNLLWTSHAVADPTGWANYGGDKSWPWPQDVLWQWPPPTKIDPGPYGVTLAKEGFRLEGPTDPVTGLAASRQTTLAADVVYNTYTFTRQATEHGDKPLGVAAWSITQTPPTGVIFVRCAEAGGRANVVTLGGTSMTAQPAGPRWVKIDPTNKTGKIGLCGDALATRLGDRVLLIERTDSLPPDDPSAAITAQLYAHREGTAADHYTELELLGPTRLLAVGESVSLRTQWRILDAAAFDRMLASP